MNRGKIIGAVVLVVAIGLIVAQQLGEDSNGGGSGISAPLPARVPSTAGSPASIPPEVLAALPAAGETRSYAIDGAGTEIHWRIYRAGTLAALGHNHVISIGALDGAVTLTSDLAAAEWWLAFPVNSLVVDDPALRARYGEEFESVPSDSDKEGTKRNMLTDRVLNGEVFPEIRLEGRGVRGSLDEAELPVTISILGRSIEQQFPASISIEPGAIAISGEYRLTHEDLGMSPFTALGGAMAVGDEIDFSYRIRAIAANQ